MLTPNHTTVGKIVKGMEIIDIAKADDFITVQSEQQRLVLFTIAAQLIEQYLFFLCSQLNALPQY